MDFEPQVITCMEQICHRQETYEPDECIQIDFSHGCDLCLDMSDASRCPTVVLQGPVDMCVTFSCVATSSPFKPYQAAVSFLGGKHLSLLTLRKVRY